MGNKFTDRTDFIIPTALLDEADWVIDSFIDSLGKNCKLIYPPKDSECINCIFDIDSQRSSGMYKAGGPTSFASHTICPVCGGEGRSILPQTADIKLRVYWSPKDWVRLPVPANTPNAVAQVIGYLTDLPKLEMATEILLESDNDSYHAWKVQRMGQAIPHGFQRRYFIQFMERISG